MPAMIEVDSSNVQAIGYDRNAQELHVHFHSGGRYVYHDVPSEVYEEFANAPSKGSYLNLEIKGAFRFTKL